MSITDSNKVVAGYCQSCSEEQGHPVYHTDTDSGLPEGHAPGCASDGLDWHCTADCPQRAWERAMSRE